MRHTIIPLKTIGLIGGSSAVATREYYRLFDDGIRAALGEHNAAELLLYSVNFQNIERFLQNGQWDDIGDYLADKAVRLERGGADFLMLVSNTMHKAAPRIVESVRIPFLDIFDVTASAIRQQGIRRVGLLGTLPVMSEPFYLDRYRSHGVELVMPDDDAKVEISRIIFEELCADRFLASSKAYYHSTIEGLKAQGIEGIVLGCTEIRLLVDPSEIPDFPVFDTAELHCRKAVEWALVK